MTLKLSCIFLPHLCIMRVGNRDAGREVAADHISCSRGWETEVFRWKLLEKRRI